MPGKIRAKKRSPKELRYDVLIPMDFTQLTLPSSAASTAIQSVIPLGVAMKIAAVAVNVQGAVNNTAKFNIVLDNNAEGTVGTADNFDTTGNITLAPAGTVVFSADQAFPTASGTTQVFQPTVGEVIYPSGHSLTLRVVTGASQTGIINVTVYGKFLDVNQTDPEAQTTAGGAPHTFQFGVDPL